MVAKVSGTSFPHGTRFKEQGSLSRPGAIGRAVRLVLGVALIWFFWVIWSDFEDLLRSSQPHWGLWIAIVYALWQVPDVFNIGFGTNWKAWPRTIVAGVIVLWAVAGRLLEGTWWTPGLGRFTWLFLLYTFGHLGLSLALAGVIATPGCEMRAVPHLWSLVTGNTTREHFCPGVFKWVDAWEAKREPNRAS